MYSAHLPSLDSPRWVGDLLVAYLPPEQMSGVSQVHFRDQQEGQSDFELFFRQYEKRVTGYLWRMTGNSDLTSDLCQETFIRAWQQFTQIATIEHPVAWLLRIATNLVLNQRRRSVAYPIPEGYDPAVSDPGRHIVERELVRQVLAGLPERQRAMLILHEVHGYSCQEVGHILEISTNAVKMGLCRAREQFRILYLRKDR